MSNETKTDEVVETLQRRIVEGIYATGQRLPGVRELAEEFHVSNPTIRAALTRLQANNVVVIIPKSGVYVRSRARRANIGPFVPPHLKKKNSAGLLRVLTAERDEITVRYLEPSGSVLAGPDLAQKMNIAEKAELTRRYRLCLVNGVPYRIVDSYHPTSILDDAGELDGDCIKGLEKSLSQANPDALERIRCRMPQEEEAKMLQISRNQPVYEIERWTFLREETLAEYTLVIANAALHEFTYTYSFLHPNWDDYAIRSRMNA